MKKKRIIISMLTLLCCCTGAWAENDWNIQKSTSGNVTTFTITRTNTAVAETVKYRLVNLSAYAGEHYNVTQVNGQNSSALSGDLTFSAGDGSKTVQVTEGEASTTAYKYQNGTTRQYRFEVTDQGGFELKHYDRTITTGISVPSSDVFAIKAMTINSGETTVTDAGYNQAYHSMTVSDYFNNAAPKTYLQHIRAELRMTLSFEAKELDHGWQYVQIYANESPSNIDTGVYEDNPGACTYSKYAASFEILDGQLDESYKTYTFPVTSAGANVKVINPWGHGSLYNLDMQKFNNSRASDGRLTIPTNLLSLYIRFNAYGVDNDDWVAKNTVAHIQAVDGTAPGMLAVSADPGYHATDNTVYVSVAFNEIVKVTGTPTLNTSNWGSLSYVAGDGTNVLTFSGVIPENASDNLDITEISGTVKDLAGNDFTGSSVTPSDPYTGSFTINANGGKVQFSKGNLQYVNGNWQFADNQYDYFGAAQSDNHKDLFGYNDYSTPDASWFNMSHDQWKYIFTTRSVTNTLSDGARYTMATLVGTDKNYKGLIIFPDDYTHPDGTGFVAGTYNNYSDFTATVSLAGWALMEAAGCVFLPAAGYKAYNYNNPADYGVEVCFNTTTTSSSGRYYTPSFRKNKVGLDDDSNYNSWTAVRLVQLIANLQKDADGNYLIGSVQDWKDFADLIKIYPIISAKMTADINLGDDQTKIGTNNINYRGTFDGQGHMLTVNWTTTGNYCAPFRYIDGATIKNLHVTGTINTSHQFTGGLISKSLGTSYVNNCRSSVEMISSYDGDAVRGGFAARVDDGGTLNFNDCVFDGTFTGPSSQTWGGFVGWIYSGSVNIENGLFVPKSVNVSATYSATFSGNGGTVTNSYYTVQINNSNQGTLVSSEKLADGTTTTALNNDRTGDDAPWVQQGNQPMLAIFANAVTLTDVNDLTALSAYAGKTCKVAYSRSFTNGKTSTVCLPFAYTKKAGDGSFYEFTDIEKKGGEYVATMTEPGESTLTANTPYLYKPNADGSVDFSGTYEIPDELVAGSTVSNGWTFKGTYTTIEWTTAPATPTYGFSASSANDGITQGQFVKVGSYVRIKPMRCYLENANFTGARGMTRAAEEELPETIKVRLISADGEVTAIGSLQTKTGEVTFDKDAWYSLDGRRIESKPSKSGLYINNGHKVIIK